MKDLVYAAGRGYIAMGAVKRFAHEEGKQGPIWRLSIESGGYTTVTKKDDPEAYDAIGLWVKNHLAPTKPQERNARGQFTK